MALEDYDGAIADFRKAHLGRPENLEIVESLIECCRLNNLPEEAEVWEKKREEIILTKSQQSSDDNDPKSTDKPDPAKSTESN